MATVIAFFAVLLVASQFSGATGTARQSLVGDAVTSGDQTFACASRSHHDGDAIRCGFAGRSMRLYGIDAPEMPGACRAGRQCTPGDPYAARDHLASLTQGRSVRCQVVDTDRYRRQVVQCSAGTIDLSCQMVRDGYATAYCTGSRPSALGRVCAAFRREQLAWMEGGMSALGQTDLPAAMPRSSVAPDHAAY